MIQLTIDQSHYLANLAQKMTVEQRYQFLVKLQSAQSMTDIQLAVNAAQ